MQQPVTRHVPCPKAGHHFLLGAIFETGQYSEIFGQVPQVPVQGVQRRIGGNTVRESLQDTGELMVVRRCLHRDHSLGPAFGVDESDEEGHATCADLIRVGEVQVVQLGKKDAMFIQQMAFCIHLAWCRAPGGRNFGAPFLPSHMSPVRKK